MGREYTVYLLEWVVGPKTYKYVGATSNSLNRRINGHRTQSKHKPRGLAAKYWVNYGEPKVSILSTHDNKSDALKSEMSFIETHANINLKRGTGFCKCGVELVEGTYHGDRPRGICKACSNARDRDYYASNRDKILSRKLAYIDTNRDHVNALRRKNRARRKKAGLSTR